MGEFQGCNKWYPTKGWTDVFFKLHSYVCCSVTNHVNQQTNNLKEIYGEMYSSEEIILKHVLICKNVFLFIPSLIFVVVSFYPATMPGAAPCHYVQHLLRGDVWIPNGFWWTG